MGDVFVSFSRHRRLVSDRYLLDRCLRPALDTLAENQANQPNEPEEEAYPVDNDKGEAERVQEGNGRSARVSFTVHRDCPRAEYPPVGEGDSIVNKEKRSPRSHALRVGRFAIWFAFY